MQLHLAAELALAFPGCIHCALTWENSHAKEIRINVAAIGVSDPVPLLPVPSKNLPAIPSTVWLRSGETALGPTLTAHHTSHLTKGPLGWTLETFKSGLSIICTEFPPFHSSSTAILSLLQRVSRLREGLQEAITHLDVDQDAGDEHHPARVS